MDMVMGTTEVDPYDANTLGTRVRFEFAYAGSWLLLGWTLVKDGIVDAAASRQHRLDPSHRAA